MRLLDRILTRLTIGKMKKPQRKRTIINELIENPENFKLEAFIQKGETEEDDVILFKVGKRTKEEMGL